MADETENRQDEQAEVAEVASGRRRRTVKAEFSATDEEQVPQMRLPAAALLFQAPDLSSVAPRRAERPGDESGEKPASEERPSAREDSGEEDGRRRRRGGRGRKKSAEPPSQEGAEDTTAAGKQDADKQDADKQDGGKKDATQEPGGVRAESATDTGEAPEEGGSRRRRRRRRPTDSERAHSEVTSVEGSTRLEAKRQRRREG
ncbi:MAG: hypothetical protein LPK38_00725, partial [Actinomycetes bacterium]|nr:hypothetical protein [Actinomycetes bacterium]MDX5379841.1 hypothetical protein [Actinomycetes bacterium]MDX5398294.1 hypothetical protein [Actinomycetes bacterium]MDX5449542.1 hypothetical protein [Actinomycetes bacterium]